MANVQQKVETERLASLAVGAAQVGFAGEHVDDVEIAKSTAGQILGSEDQAAQIEAARLGKYKTTVQMITVVILILGPQWMGGYMVLGQIGLWLVVILSMMSAGPYFISFWGRLGLGGGEA